MTSSESERPFISAEQEESAHVTYATLSFQQAGREQLAEVRWMCNPTFARIIDESITEQKSE